MLSFANMLYLFVDKLTRLSGRGLALALARRAFLTVVFAGMICLL